MKLTALVLAPTIGALIAVVSTCVAENGISPSVLLYSAIVGFILSGFAWAVSVFEKINKDESPIPEILGGLGALFVAWPLLWVLLTLGV